MEKDGMYSKEIDRFASWSQHKGRLNSCNFLYCRKIQIDKSWQENRDDDWKKAFYYLWQSESNER